ncbi:EsaB/YukD family protein [Streptomyces sp. ME03-5684b]|uniref:EsaB/YukD family protein n=1 Tax=Streptomyces sp. ME03-5684b TaxID=3028681 RepID=UPI0029B8BCF6|nr:EsaB/YukD family protein [Streptomyces sp. ME03-5684b]MDX3322427.1 EsaB/YukD family protein [Streptomyces sp. ME03-5684b]
MDEDCRITVVGGRRQVDLALPVHASITTYAGTLADLCGERITGHSMPPAWSLGPPVGEPFAPERTLFELGVVDGQILHLRDVVADEFEEPAVHDVTEEVEEVTEGLFERLWSPRARVLAVMLTGLGWLVALLVVLQVRGQLSTVVRTEVSALAGVVLAALAWVAGERKWPVPRPLREALGLAAVPLMALAGWAPGAGLWAEGTGGAAGHASRGGFGVAGLAVGALAGALLAQVAVSGVTTAVVLAAVAAAAVAAAFVAVIGADGTQAAAVVAVTAFVLLTLAPPWVSRLVAFSCRRAEARRDPEEERDDEGVLAAAVRIATTALVVWTCVLSAVLVAALVPLAASDSVSAAALAGCLSLALLLRAGGARLAAEVVPAGVAGAVGLFTLALVGGDRSSSADWTAPVGVGLAAVALLAYGFRHLMRRVEVPPRPRSRWLGTVSSLLAGTAVGLAVAVFGVYGWFIELGQRL